MLSTLHMLKLVCIVFLETAYPYPLFYWVAVYLLLIIKSSFCLSMSVLFLPFVTCILPYLSCLDFICNIFLLAEILNFYILKTINHFLCILQVCMLKRSCIPRLPQILPYFFCDFTHCKRIP